jgi:hypothetical protein
LGELEEFACKLFRYDRLLPMNTGKASGTKSVAAAISEIYLSNYVTSHIHA